MSWLDETWKHVSDALTSLKAAIAVIITGTGSGVGLLFDLFERGLALAGVIVSMTLGIFLIRKTALEIRILRKRDLEHTEERLRQIRDDLDTSPDEE